jgi:hypothetical protein
MARTSPGSALAELTAEVERQLAAHGWRRRKLSQAPIAEFSKQLSGGLMSTAELRHGSIAVLGAKWPIHLQVKLGIGSSRPRR